jgi:hypothetical protein
MKKTEYYIKIGYALVIMFSLIGVLLGRIWLAGTVAIVTALMWTISRILKEAIDAVIELRKSKDKLK